MPVSSFKAIFPERTIRGVSVPGSGRERQRGRETLSRSRQVESVEQYERESESGGGTRAEQSERLGRRGGAQRQRSTEAEAGKERQGDAGRENERGINNNVQHQTSNAVVSLAHACCLLSLISC